MLLGRWNAGGVDENTIHDDRPKPSDPAPTPAGPGACSGDGEERIGHPDQPFEEVVRMSGPSPEPGLAYLALVRGITGKTMHLLVRYCLPADGPYGHEERQDVETPEAWSGVPSSQHDEAGENEDAEPLQLEEGRHLPAVAVAPALAKLGVARIVLPAERPARDVDAEPQRPDGDNGRHHDLPCGEAAMAQRIEHQHDAGGPGAEGPGHVHPAAVAGALLHAPCAEHQEAAGDQNDDEQKRHAVVYAARARMDAYAETNAVESLYVGQRNRNGTPIAPMISL